MLKVPRESPQHKIIGLLQETPDLIDEMTHVERLNRAIIKITPQRLNFLRDFSTGIALAINLIILFWYKYEAVEQIDGSTKVEAVIANWADKTIFALGIVQTITSVMLLCMWCIN